MFTEIDPTINFAVIMKKAQASNVQTIIRK